MSKTILLIMALLLLSINASGSDIQFLTHSSKEQTYVDEKGELRGKERAGKRAFHVEIVREMMNLMNHSKKIKVIPLARGLQMVQTDNDLALFNVARTPDRENTVKWAGPLQSEIGYFYEMKNAPTGIMTVEDAKKVKIICVLRGSVHESVLQKNNFTNILPNNSYKACFQMLQAGRVNLTPSSSSALSEKLIKAGIPSDQIQQTPVIISKSVGYIAFSKNISDEVIQKWQDAFDTIQQSGKYQQLYDQFFESEDDQ